MAMVLDLKGKKILLTGGSGFLGHHIMNLLGQRGVLKENIFIPRSRDFDLRKFGICQEVVKGRQIVIHLAANVGGIGYNQARPADLLYDNLMMGAQLMEAARLEGVEKFVAIGSVCSYPKFTPVPFREESLWTGYPEETNAPYGLAKLILLEQARAFRTQYGFNAIYLVLVNMYGPHDKFDLAAGHVIPAIIRKVDEAKRADRDEVVIWGTGRASREFIYVEDAAEAIILATERYEKPEPVNLGSGQEIFIKDLVEKICALMDFKGKIVWDTTKPDGQPRRMLDVSRAEEEFGFRAKTPFDEGLRKTIAWWETIGRFKY